MQIGRFPAGKEIFEFIGRVVQERPRGIFATVCRLGE